jgi:hypothetical protein
VRVSDRVALERRLGLCASCRLGQLITSSRGSEFLLCEKSNADGAAPDAAEQYPKYPRVPVVACPGYERK